MKKIVLATVCAMAMTGAAFAQGNVAWSSISAAFMTAQTNSTQYSPFFGGGAAVGGVVGSAGGAASLGTGFYYELLYTGFSGTQATIPNLGSLFSWQDTGLSASNSTTAGRLSVINGNAGAAVPWSPGITDSIVLVGLQNHPEWHADDAIQLLLPDKLHGRPIPQRGAGPGHRWRLLRDHARWGQQARDGLQNHPDWHADDAIQVLPPDKLHRRR